MVLSIALPAQVRTRTFGTSLFSPSMNLVQGAGAHTVCNTDFSLLLELHGLQPKSTENCYCHSTLRLALISSTSWEKRGSNVEGGDPKILLSRGQLFLPPINKVFPFEEPLPNYCPLMIFIFSKTLPTLTSTRSQSDIWQDKLYFHPENKAAEGHLLQLVCSPSIKQLLPWPAKSPISIDEYNLFASLSTAAHK